MATRTQPKDYYQIRDRVLELMADQAGQPFNSSNFKNQFRQAAGEYGFRPFGDGYLPRFNTVKGWVRAKLPKQPRPVPSAARSISPSPTPQAWRNPNAFDARLAQLPPSDRD